jgi:hypothetical protein
MNGCEDLKPLKLWQPLLSFLSASQPLIRMHAAWILGTAVQNNDTAQLNFLEENGLEQVLKVLGSDQDVSVRSKALYCVSSLIRQCPQALSQFLSLSGFKIISSTLKDADLNISKKAMFLVQGLLETDASKDIQDMTRKEMTEAGFPSIILSLISHSEDEDLLEKAMNALIAWEKAENGFLKGLGQPLKETLNLVKDRSGSFETISELTRDIFSKLE